MIKNKDMKPNNKDTNPEKSDIIAKILSKIDTAESILVALPKDPSVDTMAAAIGLTLYLDQAGKRATAIYSGQTPNALNFLKPEQTFEPNTSNLQDFIIALSKEKADHLRYKVDGDFVKIFITPYRTTISSDDLEFYHGEYNVDLVLALNVDTPNDLDSALSEHGRILHDATAINITTHQPGHLGEIEWSNPAASSVSEMVFQLVIRLAEKEENIGKDVATALLTGIIAETDRFSNQKTSPLTMSASARLMLAGADQQLIAEHIQKEAPEEAPDGSSNKSSNKKSSDPAAALEAAKSAALAEVSGEGLVLDEDEDVDESASDQKPEAPAKKPQPSQAPAAAAQPEAVKAEEARDGDHGDEVGRKAPEFNISSDLVSEMQAAENQDHSEQERRAALSAQANSAMSPAPVNAAADNQAPSAPENPAPAQPQNQPSENPAATAAPKTPEDNAMNPTGKSQAESPMRGKMSLNTENEAELEKIVQTPTPVNPMMNELLATTAKNTGDTKSVLPERLDIESRGSEESLKNNAKDYGQLIEDALAHEVPSDLPNPALQAAPAVSNSPELNHIPSLDFTPTSAPAETPAMMPLAPGQAPMDPSQGQMPMTQMTPVQPPDQIPMTPIAEQPVPPFQPEPAQSEAVQSQPEQPAMTPVPPVNTEVTLPPAPDPLSTQFSIPSEMLPPSVPAAPNPEPTEAPVISTPAEPASAESTLAANQIPQSIPSAMVPDFSNQPSPETANDNTTFRIPGI